MKLRWNSEKNKKLLKKRGITFEVIEQAIASGGYVDLFDHPTRDNQKLLIVRVGEYVYAVPCILEDRGDLFLKTAFPSREYKKIYNNE